MKRFALFLVVVFLYSCANTLKYSWAPQNSHEYGQFAVKVSDYSELRTDDGALKAEAMNIKTGEKFLQGNVYPDGIYYAFNREAFLKQSMLNDCRRHTGSICILSRFMDEIYYASHSELTTALNKQKEQALKLRQHQDLQRKEQEEIRRIAVINTLKQRCIDYGFEGSRNIATCVQREAQHDYELEQKEYELQLTRQRLNQQTQSQEEPSLWISILAALAEGASEGYKQSQIISALDQRYEPRTRDIYRYCRPNC